MAKAAKVIELAISQIGYEEPNHDNFQKYGETIDSIYPDYFNGKKNGYDWCTQFAAWVFLEGYGEDKTLELLSMPRHNLSAVVKYWYNYMHKAGKIESTPKPGDLVFFQNSKGLSHIGIVIEVDNERIYTVEGNAGRGNWFVVKNSYKKTDGYIHSYGRPSYDEGYPKCPFTAISTLNGISMRNKPYSDGMTIASVKKGAIVTVEEMAGSSGDFAKISGWVYLPGGFKIE